MADSLEQQRRHGGGKPVIDLAGQRFGTMLVVDRAEKPATRSYSPHREAWWRCRCDACGAVVVLASRQIRASAWRCPCRRAAGRPSHAGSSEPRPPAPPTRPKPTPMPPPQPPTPHPPSPGARAAPSGR